MQYQEYQPIFDEAIEDEKFPVIQKSNKRKYVALLILFLVTFSFVTFLSRPKYQNAISKLNDTPSYNEFRLPNDITPSRYIIGLDIEMPTIHKPLALVKGQSIIHVNVNTPTSKLIFHIADQNITYTQLSSSSGPIDIASQEYNTEMEYQILNFNAPLQVGDYILELKYQYFLNNDLRGFYVSRYKTSSTSKSYFLAITQFEATDARRAFPNFDEPEFKAVFEITLHVDNQYHALSNMPSTVTNHNDKTVYTFDPTPKMSSYLVAFCVSQFEATQVVYYKSIAIKVWTRQGMTYQGTYAADAAKVVLKEYTNLFQIDYPLPKLDMIAVPDFSAGAMENWGLITYRDTAILIDPKISTNSNYQRVATVIAHELAHQWFGNLVTMAYWDELFLNEGFATLMEYKGANAVNKTWQIKDQFYIMDSIRALDVDATVNTHSIHVGVKSPAEIGKIFDGISYSKAGSCLRMLEFYVNGPSPNAFFSGLTTYLTKHSYGNAHRDELWDSFPNLPIKEMMTTWTEQPGYPIIEIEIVNDILILTQSRFMINPIANDQTWIIPFSYQVYTNTSGTIEKSKVEFILLRNKVTKIPITTKDIFIIKGNVHQQGFYRVKIPQNWYLIAYDWFVIDPTFMSNMDRAGLIEDALALVMTGQSDDLAGLFQITRILQHETDYIVWTTAINRFNEIESVLRTSPFYSQFKLYLRYLLDNISNTLGWHPQHDHVTSLLQSVILNQAIVAGNRHVIDAAFDIFKKQHKQGEDEDGMLVLNKHGEHVSLELLHVADKAAVMYGYELEYNIIYEKYKKSIFAQEQQRLLVSLASSLQGHLSMKTLDLSISDHVRSQDAVRLMVIEEINLEFGCFNSANGAVDWMDMDER